MYVCDFKNDNILVMLNVWGLVITVGDIRLCFWGKNNVAIVDICA